MVEQARCEDDPLYMGVAFFGGFLAGKTGGFFTQRVAVKPEILIHHSSIRVHCGVQ